MIATNKKGLSTTECGASKLSLELAKIHLQNYDDMASCTKSHLDILGLEEKIDLVCNVSKTGKETGPSDSYSEFLQISFHKTIVIFVACIVVLIIVALCIILQCRTRFKALWFERSIVGRHKRLEGSSSVLCVQPERWWNRAAQGRGY